MQMRKKGLSKKPPREDALDGAVDAFHLLRWIHPPTASALLIGGAAGMYLAWKLFQAHGILAVLLGVGFGAVVGAVLGVCLYWLYRFFQAF